MYDSLIVGSSSNDFSLLPSFPLLSHLFLPLPSPPFLLTPVRDLIPSFPPLTPLPFSPFIYFPKHFPSFLFYPLLYWPKISASFRSLIDVRFQCHWINLKVTVAKQRQWAGLYFLRIKFNLVCNMKISVCALCYRQLAVQAC